MKWKMIDRWEIGNTNETPHPELMIVEGENGRRVLLARRKPNIVEVAQWREACEILPTDTRETLSADAGLESGMCVWQVAMNGYDDDRQMLDWNPMVCTRIANGTED